LALARKPVAYWVARSTPDEMDEEAGLLHRAWVALMESPEDWEKMRDVRLRTEHLFQRIITARRAADGEYR
jgi:hypothetical protein